MQITVAPVKGRFHASQLPKGVLMLCLCMTKERSQHSIGYAMVFLSFSACNAWQRSNSYLAERPAW